MNQSDCPSEGELRAYVLGKLPEDLAEQTEQHLQVCQACELTAESLERQIDSLVEQIRRPPSDDPYLAEPQCQLAVAKAKLAAGKVVSGEGRPNDLNLAPPADLGHLGDYQLLAKLGEGGMGAVYKARQTRLKKTVALKVLPEGRTTDPRAVTRFEREMEAIGQLSHPNIVQAFDAGDIQGTNVLVMEFVDGLDLARVVECVGRLRVSDACELVRQISTGLQYAHEHGLVHRDIKPSNLMLTPQGQIKILDLGLALLRTDQPGSGQLTSSGQTMGTADYMAPEQASNAHSVDVRADIYSLGCTLYMLLAGRAPFSGPQYKTQAEKLVGHLKEFPPPVRQFRNDVPAELAVVIERMMAKSPDDRFASPAEVAAAMAPFAAGCDLVRVSAEAAAAAIGTVPREQRLTGTEPFASSAVVDTDADGTRARASAPSVTSFRQRIGVRGIIALGLSAVVLLGAILTIITRQGTLLIESDDPNVQVAVKQDGKVVEVVDAKSGWKISLKSGEYELAPQGSTDQFQLNKDSVVVRRGDTVKVRFTLRPPTDPRPTAPWIPPPGAPPPVAASFGAHVPSAVFTRALTGAPPPDAASFGAKKAKEHQATCAKRLGVPVEITNSIGMKLVLIPPGEFDMGSPKELIEAEARLQRGPDNGWWRYRLPGELPQHRVRITKPYRLGVTEVTQEEYQRVMGSNPSQFQGDPKRPVEQVSWDDAVAFCRKLSELPGEKAVKRQYELPTEAQWEYACRAESTVALQSAVDPVARLEEEMTLGEYGWFIANSAEKTHPVGQKRANAFGLNDMYGNVAERCADWYQSDYYAKSPVDNPRGPPKGSERVVRGGCWYNPPYGCRLTARVYTPPAFKDPYTGFRVAQVLVDK